MSFGDLLGWGLAFLLPVFAVARPLRRDQGAAQAFLIAVLLHIAAAAMYIYFKGILPIRADAQAFHNYAVSRQWMTGSSFGIGSDLYKEFLALLYSVIGPSFFLGAILSIYAFTLSALVFMKIMELLDIHQGKGLALLLFGALPTSVLYGSVPMREPYQVLFFMLACYSMLRFRLTNQPLHLINAIVFAFLMGMLHKGLILYAPFLITIMLFVRVERVSSLSKSTRRNVWLHRFVAVALAISFAAWASGAAQRFQGIGGTEVLLTATTGDGLVEYTEGRRDDEALSKGRTAYGVALDTSSPVQFLYSSAMIYFYYMFTPFPWDIRNLLDVYAFGEVILRIVCLVAIFRMWCRGGTVRPQIITLLMVVYFSMAFLWAAGTTNYGTATRHHMIHQWILLLLGVPALIHSLPGLARHDTMTQRAGSLRSARSRESRIQPRIPHLKPLPVGALLPIGLGTGRRPMRGLQIATATLHQWAGGLRPPRRLTEE